MLQQSSLSQMCWKWHRYATNNVSCCLLHLVDAAITVRRFNDVFFLCGVHSSLRKLEKNAVLSTEYDLTLMAPFRLFRQTFETIYLPYRLPDCVCHCLPAEFQGKAAIATDERFLSLPFSMSKPTATLPRPFCPLSMFIAGHRHRVVILNAALDRLRRINALIFARALFVRYFAPKGQF